MKYFIGIDGGGTKTALKLSDENRNLILTNEGGACNINSMGKDSVEKMLNDLINDTLNKANISLEDIAAMCIGTAGVDRKEDKKIFHDMIKGFGFKGKFIVTNDAEIALFGGVGGEEGIILISGTGSICYGRNKEGKVKRAGGWGHIIGDEGSGYYIGISAINHIGREHDGIEEKTIMSDLILKHLNLKSAEGLIEYVYRSGAGKAEIASLARFVDEAYKNGDNIARGILLKAASELFMCCKAVIQTLNLENREVFLALNGSVVVNNECVRDELNRLIKEKYPKIKVINMKYDAAWGAVLMAMKL